MEAVMDSVPETDLTYAWMLVKDPLTDSVPETDLPKACSLPRAAVTDKVPVTDLLKAWSLSSEPDIERVPVVVLLWATSELRLAVTMKSPRAVLPDVCCPCNPAVIPNVSTISMRWLIEQLPPRPHVSSCLWQEGFSPRRMTSRRGIRPDLPLLDPWRACRLPP